MNYLCQQLKTVPNYPPKKRGGGIFIACEVKASTRVMKSNGLTMISQSKSEQNSSWQDQLFFFRILRLINRREGDMSKLKGRFRT